MSMGYDVGELLVQIKAKDAEIMRLVASHLDLSEPELRLTIAALRQAHAPTIPADATSVIQKLCTALDRIEEARRAEADFVASLTDEEREVIWARRRASKSGAVK